MELLQFCRIILIFISWMGYCRILSKKTDINMLFAPAIVMSSQMLIMFFAGILNMMMAFTLLLFICGLLLFVFQARKEGLKAFFAPFCSAGFAFFIIAATAYYIASRKANVNSYDDFTHWALIVKQMLTDNRYPNFENIIMFQAYPPGSASFIYYFCTLSGGGEGIWIYAQGLLELAFILPIFVFCSRKYSLPCIAYCLLFANYIMCTLHLNQSLYVDILLALSGAAAMLFVWYYLRENVVRERERERDFVTFMRCSPACGLCSD